MRAQIAIFITYYDVTIYKYNLPCIRSGFLSLYLSSSVHFGQIEHIRSHIVHANTQPIDAQVHSEDENQRSSARERTKKRNEWTILVFIAQSN